MESIKNEEGYPSEDKVFKRSKFVLRRKRRKGVPIYSCDIFELKNEKELEDLIKLFPRASIKQITTSFFWDNENWFEKRNFVKIPRYEIVVDLSRTEEEIKSSFEKSVRKNLKKVGSKIENGEIKLVELQKKEELQKFYDLFIEARKRLKREELNFDFFEGIYTNFVQKGKGKIWGVEKENRLISGLIIIYNDFYSMEKVIVSDTQNLNTSDFLKWVAIKFSKENNLKFFNLTGVDISVEHAKTYAIYRFKRKFGELKKFHTYIKPKIIGKLVR